MRDVLAPILRRCLLPRMWMGPPAWWLKAHPDAVMKWDDAARHPADAAVDSPEYLRDAAERLRALVERQSRVPLYRPLLRHLLDATVY